jgi:hypothetical protein
MERTRWMLVLGLVVLPVALLCHSPAEAQVRRTAGALESGAPAVSPRSVSAARVQEAPSVDGILDEAIWERAPVADGFVQREPDEGAAASEPSAVRVAYDDEALYIGARLYDSRPEGIQSVLARRDTDTPADEFWVALDSYNDRRTAFVFVVNPAGTKSDWLIYDGNRTDRGWDAVWDVATRVDSAGWTVEMTIPLNQLRFSIPDDGADAGAEAGADGAAGAGAAGAAVDSGLVWGLNFIRRIARHNEYNQWSLIPQDAQEWVAYYGELRGLDLDEAPRRLEIRPYTLAKVARAPVAPGDPFHSLNEWGGTAGVDVQLGLLSDLTLSATVNPDFGQVEADPSQVNLTANELFLPERRPFFVEGADLFQGPMPSPFYSRRIGRAPQGRVPGAAAHVDMPDAVRILGATKLTGKTSGGWSIGLLDAVTGEGVARWVDGAGTVDEVAVEPLTNYAVARVARDFRSGRSKVGMIATATNRRIQSPGLRFLRDAAYVAGLDWQHRFGDFNLRGSVVGSSVHGHPEALDRAQRSPLRYFHRPDADHLEYDPERTSLQGWGTQFNLAKVAGSSWRYGVGSGVRSPGLEMNDLGFQREADVASGYAWIGYERYDPTGPFRRFTLFLNQWNRWSFGGENTGREVNLFSDFQLMNFWEGRLHIGHGFEALDPQGLRGGPALVRDGNNFAWLNLSTPETNRLTGRLNIRGLRLHEGDGYRFGVSAEVGLRPTPGFELSLAPGVSWNRDPSQYVTTVRHDGDAHYVLGRLRQVTTSLTTRLNYTFSPTLSFELYAQPFISAGRYTSFYGVADPRASRFDDRFRPLDVRYDDDEGRYHLTSLAGGERGPGFGAPDFTVRELNTNAVLRWEYRPGSTLYLVWSQGRSAYVADGRFDLVSDARGLVDAPGTNVLMLKLSYWLDG